MGLAAAATIVVAVLVALTLVPAVLSLFGRRALPRRYRDLPAATSDDGLWAAGATTRRPAHAAPRRGFLTRWVELVTRRRVTALLFAVVALAAVAVPVASMRTTLVPTPAEDSTQARAEQLLAGAFGEGFNGPLTVLFDGDSAVSAAAELGTGISSLDDVVAVAPAVSNADGTAALVTVVPESGPATEATERLVADLRSYLDDAAADGSLPGAFEASVTGATAVSVDVAETLDDALPVYLTLVVGLALVLLVLVFRSLLVPLVGVLGFLLTVGATSVPPLRSSSGGGSAGW